MASSFSSSSPEFWLHHCMIDYVWFRWQRQGRDYRDIYFKKKNYRLLGSERCPRDLIDVRKQPGHVSVTYKIFGMDRSVPRKDNGYLSFQYPEEAESNYLGIETNDLSNSHLTGKDLKRLRELADEYRIEKTDEFIKEYLE